MYDLPFIPDDYQIKQIPRPFPWIPIKCLPKKDGKYLVSRKSVDIPEIFYYKNNDWHDLSGNKFDDVSYWGYLPEVAKIQYARNK